MSLVIAATERRAERACASRSTSAVLPEPTGPPTPTRTGFRILSSNREKSGHTESGIQPLVPHRGDVQQRRRGTKIMQGQTQRVGRARDDLAPGACQDALGIELAEWHQACGDTAQPDERGVQESEQPLHGRDASAGSVEKSRALVA